MRNVSKLKKDCFTDIITMNLRFNSQLILYARTHLITGLIIVYLFCFVVIYFHFNDSEKKNDVKQKKKPNCH